MLRFIQKIYKNKKKEYHLLLFILVVLSAFEFCFLAMYDAYVQFDFPWHTRIAMHAIPTLPSFIALVLSVFVIKYFIANKKQEFSILLLSGRKPKDLFMYIIIQFGILTVLSFIIGIPFGMLIMSLINACISYAALPFYLDYHLMNVILYNLCFLLITIVIILAICSQQFVILDKDIAKHISHKDTLSEPAYKIKMSSVKEKKKIPVFSIIMSFFILYLTVSSVMQLLNSQLSTTDLMMSFAYVLAGEVFIVNLIVPLLYDLLHNRFLLKHPILMNGLASFNEYSKTMVVLMNLNACIIPLMLFLLFFSAGHQLILATLLPCFIMTIIMICLCFSLRFSIYIHDQASSIAIFHSIGYSQKKLKSISFIKNGMFVLLAIVVPFLFVGELLYKAYGDGLLNLGTIMMIAVSYIVLYSVVIIYTFIKDKNTQKEVISNVKYLNRG